MNPLAAFRKYQKILLVVFGVALMIAFTVGGLVSQYVGQGNGRRGGENTLVVQWKGGSFRENDMYDLRQKRNAMMRFLQVAQATARERGATPPDLPLAWTDDERTLVEIELLAEEARKMGIEVDEKAIESYLQYATANELQPQQLGEILIRVTERRMSRIELFSLLEKELLAQKLRNLVTSGQFPSPPGVAWDYYNRLEGRIEAEVLPVPVEDFLSRVDAPNEAELRELYEEHKSQYPSPSLPDPGFKWLPRARFQYLKFDFQSFLEPAMAKITEDQIKEYYEEKKDDFKIVALPDTTQFGLSDDLGNPEGSDATTDDAETKDADASDAGEDDTSEPDADADASETDLVDPDADGTDDVDSDVSDTDQEDTSETDASATDESDRDPSDNGTSDVDDQSVLNRRLTTLPVALQDESADTDETAAEASTDQTTSDQTTSDQTTSDQTTSDQTTTDQAISNDDLEAPDEPTEPVTEETPATTAGEATAKPATASAEDTFDGDIADVESAAAKEEPKYKPMEEVSDEIRRILAEDDAVDAMEDAMKAVRSNLAGYKDEYDLWQLDRLEDKSLPEPKSPDFNQLAATYQLEAGETPAVDILDIQDEKYDIARSYQLDFSRGAQPIPFPRIAFAENLPLFDVRETRASDFESKYLFWKTEYQEEKVPTFEEAKPDVERAWRMSKAVGLAKKEAESLAKQVNQSGGKSLSEVHGETQPVTDTGEFSWLTEGSIAPTTFRPSPPRLSSVPGVEFPGNDFMQQVFRLNMGETGIAINHPKSMVYVVYAKSRRNPEDIRDQFFASGLTGPIVMVGYQENQRDMFDWYKSFEENYDVQWERDPERASGT